MEIAPLFQSPASGGGASAVLVLFAAGWNGHDLLLIQRNGGLQLHAGEPVFPSGTIEADDDGPVAAALPEAAEEVGVDAGGVDVVATLPELFILPARFQVVPLLAGWERPWDGAEITDL